MKLSNPISIVLHHSVTRRGNTLSEEERIWNEIKGYGIQKHGYPDYHFGVGYSGTIYTGCPLDIVAAHCGIDVWDEYQDDSGVTNQNSVAICAIGNFEEYPLSENQINGIVKCIRNIKIKYPKLFLKIHREIVATACPGSKYNYQEIYKRRGEKMFDDVDPKRWSYPAIKKLTDKGIMKGDEKGFRPRENITREEVAQVISNLLTYLGK